MENGAGYSEQNRLIAKALTLYYMENFSQADIAARLSISVAKVNRLLKAARQSGMVEVNIRIPNWNLYDLETKLCERGNLQEVIVTPSVETSSEGVPTLFAQMAARYFINQLQPKDKICIGGGRTILEVINQVEPTKIPGVRIYPAFGGVQRDLNRDINGLSGRLAEKLGGEVFQFYAPTFVENETERDTLIGMTHVVNALEAARGTRIALSGIGGLNIGSSIIQYCSIPYHRLSELVVQRNGVGEVLGYVIDAEGRDCIPEVSRLIIGLSLEDFRQLPVRIGAAAGAEKGPAIAAAIRGSYFTALILDENAARQVLSILEKE